MSKSGFQYIEFYLDPYDIQKMIAEKFQVRPCDVKIISDIGVVHGTAYKEVDDWDKYRNEELMKG